MPWSTPIIAALDPADWPGKECRCLHGRGAAHQATYSSTSHWSEETTNAAGEVVVVKNPPQTGYVCTNRAAAIAFQYGVQWPVGGAKKAPAAEPAPAAPAAAPALRESKADYVRSQGQTREHDCHWPGCGRQVPPAVWGCKDHWFRLPKALRDRIWAAYRPGQEKDMRPSDTYLDVADAVQRWIAEHGNTAPARAPKVFEIPPGTPMSTCSSCSANIRWIVTDAGKRMPVNLDGISHFATCPNANQHRARK